jgi:uncharacterized membrane protein YfcA
MLADAVTGALLALCVAALSTPVGVSGAVLLVPVQVSVLHTPSPAVTPTNLLYNLVAIPGALLRFHQEGRLLSPLTRLLVLGTLPGVIVGAVIRVEFLAGPEAFYLVIAAVLMPLGIWLALASPRRKPPARPAYTSTPVGVLALLVGVVGGIYGIGGGSILGPALVGLGFTVVEVSPAALMATFLTSIAGVATYAALSLTGDGNIAPEWMLGLALGLGACWVGVSASASRVAFLRFFSGAVLA